MLVSSVSLLAAVAAVNAVAVPRAASSEQPNLIARGSGVNIAIKHDPLSYAADPKERRQFFERNDIATRSKYVDTPEGRAQVDTLKRQAETNTPFNNWRRDLLYSIEIQIGTPGQNIEVHMDTGSSDFYVYDKTCQSQTCSEVTKFNNTQSSTFERYNTSAKTTLTYGSGFAYGYWSKDTVTAGGFSVPGQAFLSASLTDAGYRGTDVSGLIGFGWPDLAVSKESPWWYTSAQTWEDKRFGCFLDRRPWNNPGTDPRPAGVAPGGTLTLGGVDESLFTGDIKYYPVTEKRFWKIDLEGVDINGKSVSSGDSKAAVVDTGSTLTYGPPAVIQQIYDAIPGSSKQANSGMYNIPCDTKADLAFKFGGDSYKILAADFVHTRNETTGQCTGALIGQNLGAFSWVVGDMFLKNVYSVFQYDPPAVGFAQLANSPTIPQCKRKNAVPVIAEREVNEPYWNEKGKLAWRPAL